VGVVRQLHHQRAAGDVEGAQLLPVGAGVAEVGRGDLLVDGDGSQGCRAVQYGVGRVGGAVAEGRPRRRDEVLAGGDVEGPGGEVGAGAGGGLVDVAVEALAEELGPGARRAERRPRAAAVVQDRHRGAGRERDLVDGAVATGQVVEIAGRVHLQVAQ